MTNDPKEDPVTITDLTLDTYASRLRERPEEWLGLLVYYSVSDTVVPHADLVAALTRAGLEKFAPKRPADVDVFRRTCTNAAKGRQRQSTAEEGVYANVLMRDVGVDEERCLKRLVIETVNGAAETLSYSEVHDLVFTKATSSLDVRRIGNMTSPVADEVALEITREFRRLVGTVNGNAVRDLINKVLVESNATSLRPGGGVYFSPPAVAQVVDGLEQLAGVIDGTMVHSVPLPDDVKQRGMLREAFEDEAKAEVDRTVTEIAGMLREGVTVTGAQYGAIAARYRKMTAKAEQYAAMLRTDLGATNAALEVLDMQMRQLAGKAK